MSDIIIDGLKKNDFDRKITCNTSKLKNKIDKLRSKKENKKNGFINDIILPIGLTMSATEADRLAGETKKILPNSFKFYVSKGSYFKDARYYWYDEKNYPDIVVLFNYIKETTYVNNIPTHTQYRLNFEVKYFSDRTKKSLNIGK